MLLSCFGAGAPFTGEDTDFVARASWNGWRGKFDPRPVVAHHHGRKPGDDEAARRREYEYGRGAYYAKFMLDRRARSIYFGHWRWFARNSTYGDRASKRRELVGAARYLTRRLARR